MLSSLDSQWDAKDAKPCNQAQMFDEITAMNADPELRRKLKKPMEARSDSRKPKAEWISGRTIKLPCQMSWMGRLTKVRHVPRLRHQRRLQTQGELQAQEEYKLQWQKIYKLKIKFNFKTEEDQTKDLGLQREIRR